MAAYYILHINGYYLIPYIPIPQPKALFSFLRILAKRRKKQRLVIIRANKLVNVASAKIPKMSTTTIEGT